jgi:parvulin-like peptidyl-prolyl isomerase
MSPKKLLTVVLALSLLLTSSLVLAAEKKTAASPEELLYKIAQLNLNHQQYAEAIAAFTDLLEIYPKSKQVKDYSYYLGLAYEHSGDYQKAAEVYQKVVTIYKDKPSQMAQADSLAMEGVGRCFNKNFKEYSVVINGQPITKLEFDAELEKVPPQYRSQFESEDGRKQFLERLVQKKLLYDEAVKTGAENDPAVYQQLTDSRYDILIRSLYNREVIQKSQPTEEEIKKNYQANKDAYKISEQVKARNIIVSTKAEAEKVLKLAQMKKSFFDSLAIKYSVSGNSHTGGDMGQINRVANPDLDQVLFVKTPKGKISSVTPISPKFAVVKRIKKEGSKLHLRWIVFNTEEEAKKVIAELTAKPDQFDSLAGKLSADAATKDKAGDLGLVDNSQVDPKVFAAAGKLKDGAYTLSPVKYFTQYAIYKIEEKTPAGFKPLDQVKSQISGQLQRDQQKTYFDNLLNRLKSAASITYPEETPAAPAQPEQKEDGKK